MSVQTATVRAPATAPPRDRLALAIIVSCQLMLVVDATVMNVALPHIRADLGFSPTGLSWVMNAYTLAFGGLLLLGGRAGDIFGRRRLFVGGIALFTLASLAGGLATDAQLADRRPRPAGRRRGGRRAEHDRAAHHHVHRAAAADPRPCAAVRHGQRRLRDRPRRGRPADPGRLVAVGAVHQRAVRRRGAGARAAPRTRAGAPPRPAGGVRRRHRDRRRGRAGVRRHPRGHARLGRPGDPRHARRRRRADRRLRRDPGAVAATADAVAPLRRPGPRGGVRLLPARARGDDVDVLLPDPVPAVRARLRPDRDRVRVPADGGRHLRDDPRGAGAAPPHRAQAAGADRGSAAARRPAVADPAGRGDRLRERAARADGADRSRWRVPVRAADAGHHVDRRAGRRGRCRRGSADDAAGRRDARPRGAGRGVRRHRRRPDRNGGVRGRHVDRVHRLGRDHRRGVRRRRGRLPRPPPTRRPSDGGRRQFGAKGHSS